MEAVTDQPHLRPDPDDTGSSRPEGSRAFSSLDLDEQEELGGYGDQIDRSVVMSEWLKSFAMWALRMLIIAVFLYVAWFLLKQVGTGVLPVAFAIIVCTVLAPPTTWMRRKGLPPALAALISMLAFFGFFGSSAANSSTFLTRRVSPTSS